MAGLSRSDFVVSALRSQDPRLLVLDVGLVGEQVIPEVHLNVLKALSSADRVIGIDLDPVSLAEWAAARPALPVNAQYLAGSAYQLPFAPGSFDVALFLEVFEHLLHPFTAIREIKRVLRPGGLLILTTPNPLSVNKMVDFLVSRDAYSAKAVARYRQHPEHKLMPHPQGLVAHLEDLGFHITSVAHLKWRWPWMRRFRPTRRMSVYQGLVATKLDETP